MSILVILITRLTLPLIFERAMREVSGRLISKVCVGSIIYILLCPYPITDMRSSPFP